MILSPHEIAWLALNVGRFPTEEARICIAVQIAESGGDTDAIGRSKDGPSLGQRDHGGGQISGRWHGAKLQKFRFRDPYDNMRMVRLVYDEALRQKPNEPGWWPWNVFIGGQYETFLPDAGFGLAYPFEPINPATTAWRKL